MANQERMVSAQLSAVEYRDFLEIVRDGPYTKSQCLQRAVRAWLFLKEQGPFACALKIVQEQAKREDTDKYDRIMEALRKAHDEWLGS